MSQTQKTTQANAPASTTAASTNGNAAAREAVIEAYLKALKLAGFCRRVSGAGTPGKRWRLGLRGLPPRATGHRAALPGAAHGQKAAEGGEVSGDKDPGATRLQSPRRHFQAEDSRALPLRVSSKGQRLHNCRPSRNRENSRSDLDWGRGDQTPFPGGFLPGRGPGAPPYRVPR